MTHRPVVAALAVWLAAALVIAISGLLRRSPVPPPAIAVGLTIVLLLLVRSSSRIRAAASRLGPRPLVLFHVIRVAAGAYFLVLYRRGVLPGEFAVAAGWGDIAVGMGAVAVALWCLPLRTRRQRVGLVVWNVAGLVDILGVLGNGIRIFVAAPAVAAPFTSLPLALLPTFVVPLVIVSHVLLFAWTVPRSDRPMRA